MNSSIDLPRTLVTPSRGWVSLKLGEMWEYRELLYFFIWRDVKVRYKQTALGVSWAILQPFLTMVLFSLFFGRLAKVPSDGVPYPIFAYTALLPWTFFAHGVTLSANSVVANANLVKKVYFPRMAIPVASVLSGFADLVPAFIVLVGMMFYYGIYPSAQIVWLPVFVVLALIAALGVGIGLAAINVHFRDVRHTVPFLVQSWLFITPIAYPSSLLPEHWKTIYALNPMVGVVEGFRWALLDTEPAPGPILWVSAAAALVLLLLSALYFRHLEKTFADVV
ncbi:MAG: ABC transporter permease [Candidatus Binatia bacterium]